MNLDWIMSGIRSIAAALDRFIYSFISIIYQILINLSSTTIFSNESINEFSNRVYVLVGIIMLFKVTFSLINYLVNPDSISDKVNGAGNVAKNIVITLVLIIIVPYAFDFLYRAQYAIINDNIIPKLILGSKSDSIGEAKIKLSDQKYNNGAGNDVCSGNNDGYVPVKNNGDYISLMTFRPFFKVSDEIIGNTSAPSDAQPYIDVFCMETTVKDILVSETYNATYNKDKFIFDYSIFFSTFCGVIVALMLLSYTFDIAVRTIKLGFLEIFAPIPIISYVDPKSGKDGMFKKWLKEVWQTWLSLFVRLVTLFFAIYIIKLINENTIQYSGDYKMWAMLFLIIGALMFAKQAPKLLEDIIGVKSSLQLNPLKKIRDEAVGGKLVAGAATGAVAGGIALAGGAAANVWAFNQNKAKENKKIRGQLEKEGLRRGTFEYRRRFAEAGGIGFEGGVLNGLGSTAKAAGSIVAGGGSAATRAMGSSLKGDKFTPIKNATSAVTASSKARNARADGWGISNRIHDNLTDIAGIKSTTGTTSERKNEINQLKLELENVKRDEQRYSLALSNIETASDGYYADQYADAFNYKPVKDDEGNITYEKQTPNTYNDWVGSRLNLNLDDKLDENGNVISEGYKTKVSNMVNNSLAFKNLTDEQRNAKIEESISNYVNGKVREYNKRVDDDHARGIMDEKNLISRSQYDTYEHLANLRNKADLDGKKLEKNITKKQEQVDNQKKKN